jgi:predicted phage terminase large subunit-like protein
MSNTRSSSRSSPLAELLSRIAIEDRRRKALREEHLNKTKQELLDESRARCKTLAGFVREAWHVLEPRARYVHGPHIDAICQHLEAVSTGQINRLLMNVPPGAMKSLLTSVFWPAYEWGPLGMSSMRYLATAFNDGPVKRDSRKCRDLVLSEWYQERWPSIVLTRAGETSFANTATGSREGVAFGSLTSQRGDRLIIDDPQSIKTAESKLQLVETTRLFREGALNRLNDQTLSALICIMQRLAVNDISDAFLEVVAGTVHLRLPMEFERSACCYTRIDFKDWRTEEGELLEPVRFPRQVIDDLKRGMGAHAYAGQYQQRPTARAGGMFQRDWFEGKILDALPAGLTRRVRSWDLAASAPDDSADPDFTVGAKIETDDKIFVISDVDEFQKNPGGVRKAIKDKARADTAACDIAIPEDPGQAGKDQAQSIISENAGYRITAIRQTGDKGTRADPFAAQCEAGNVFLLKGPWNESFIDQLCGFPKGHDDQVDAVSQGFNYLAGQPASSFFDLNRMLLQGYPVPMPGRIDSIFAVVCTAIKTGKESDTAGVVYFGRREFGGYPVTILDWDIAPVDATLIDGWFKQIFVRAEELAKQCAASAGFVGAFVRNKDSGAVLFSQGEKRGLPVVEIEEDLAKLGVTERAMNVAPYIDQGSVKIAGPAFEKRIELGGQIRNHFVDQLTAFRLDDKDAAKTSGDLLDCLVFGIALALGNADGR